MRLRMRRRIMHIVYGVVQPRSCFLATTIFPKFFPLFTSTLSPHATESRNLGFRIRLTIGIRNPVPEIRNPRRGIQNPSLYWIPLLGPRNRKIIEKSFSSESSWLIRTSRLAIESRQPTNAICIYNIQEKVSLT